MGKEIHQLFPWLRKSEKRNTRECTQKREGQTRLDASKREEEDAGSSNEPCRGSIGKEGLRGRLLKSLSGRNSVPASIREKKEGRRKKEGTLTKAISPIRDEKQ